MSDHGYHPLSKYSSARDDILHYLCTSDWANDSFGNVGDYGSYVWKISNDPADVSIDNTEFSSIFEEWRQQCPEVIDSPELRSELVGHFIVTTVDSGFVYVSAYDTVEALEVAYSSAEEAYAEWSDEEYDDDGHHVPSRIEEEHEYKFGDDRL
jgi:hypothetical protein